MKTPKVSIIVPCYNQAHYLNESLQSVLNQTYTDWQCIIVNDGSPDDTEVIARQWEVRDSRFIYLYQENAGVSSARNLGITTATADFILTLDADDKYEPSFLEKAMKVLAHNPEIGIVSSWGRCFTDKKKLQVFKSTASSVSDFLFYNGLNNGSSLFRKGCWEQAGGYDENPENGLEDWEFYLRVCDLGWKVHIIEEVLFFYRQHATSRTIAVNKKHNQAKKYLFLKNKAIYCTHYETLIDQFLKASDLEKAEINKFKYTIDYKLGAAILKPLRRVKWFFLKFLK